MHSIKGQGRYGVKASTLVIWVWKEEILFLGYSVECDGKVFFGEGYLEITVNGYTQRIPGDHFTSSYNGGDSLCVIDYNRYDV